MEFVKASESNEGEEENIWIAASDGDLERVQHLVATGISVNAQDEYGYSPMHAAASYGEVDLINYLMQNGAQVDIRDNDGDTPLLVCEKPEVFELLIKHGANPRAVNELGQDVVQKAAEDENEELVEYLISKEFIKDPEQIAKLRQMFLAGENAFDIEMLEEGDEEAEEEDEENEMQG